MKNLLAKDIKPRCVEKVWRVHDPV